MSHNTKIVEFAKNNEQFQKVLAGKVTTQDFFTKPEFAESKEQFMSLYSDEIGPLRKGTFYNDEAVAAAWIAKSRYNEEMSDELFVNYINRSEEIFNPPDGKVELNLRNQKSEGNDLCAIMWGIEALNGIQSFDTGATRVRLPPGVAPQIVQALETGGAKPRDSTHATGTKLVDKGLGKDLNEESLRKYTPRGMGAILVVPTSPDGTGTIAKATDTGISGSIASKDYDLLLKREDYGYNDTTIHSRVHSKLGFINYLDEQRQKYQEGLALSNKKSSLALSAEEIHGTGKAIHRKEHLSELKEQSSTLVSLLEEGKKHGLFGDFTTKWAIRIKWPPFEKKIVSSDPNSRKGLGDFLQQIAKAQDDGHQFSKQNIDKVEGLIAQARAGRDGPFQQCREGNEVLANCEHGKARLVENIGKSTENDPVNRATLDPTMVSEKNPELSMQCTQSFKELMSSGRNKAVVEDAAQRATKEAEQEPAPDSPGMRIG